MPDLQLHRIQALIEIYEGDFYAHQACRRVRSCEHHQSMMAALQWNCEQGNISIVGAEHQVTEKGKDWLRAIGGVPPQD